MTGGCGPQLDWMDQMRFGLAEAEEMKAMRMVNVRRSCFPSSVHTDFVAQGFLCLELTCKTTVCTAGKPLELLPTASHCESCRPTHQAST
jgi:hypothetical protein